MATIAGIRDGLKVRLATISGLRAHDTWPGTINTPCAIVKPASLGKKGSMGGHRPRAFEIILLSAPMQNGVAQAQDKLDAYLDDTGSTSVVAALEGDKTLGGIIDTLDVSWRDYGDFEIPAGSGIRYAGVVFDVDIWD